MLAVIAALVTSACGPSPVKTTPVELIPTPSLPAASPAGVTVVRWFVGLGLGDAANQVSAEEAFVKAYNASQNEIYISLEIVPTDTAYETLQAEIANGNAPDIVGPVGVRSRNGFGGDFLDLSGEIAKTGYDMTRFPSAVVDLLEEGTSQVGIPYLIDPGFIFYNKDIFAKANLPDLPTKVGDPWNGQPWTWDTLETIAAQLTVDTKGKKSTDTGFSPTSIAQYGIDFQWADGRTMASCFSAGTFLGPAGTATIPAGWEAAWTWYYNAMWQTHIAPTEKVIDSALLGNGSTVASGHLAMAVSWPWAISTYGGPVDKNGNSSPKFAKWGIAVMPSYNGLTSSPMDADTFVIPKGSAHPDAAFTAMTAIMADKSLQIAYGGMPAATADQPAWFAQFNQYLAKIFPGNTVSWSVLQEMENYPANPSPEADLPNFQTVINLTAAFYTKMQTTNGLNLTNEFTNLQNSIQKAFEQASLTANP
jgi:multiple sugar transport system substrate-binding protein